MMRLFKCDVCGAIYYTEGIRTLTIYTKYNDTWFFNDLCPKCEKSLKKWYDTQKEQNNGNI